MLRSLPSADLPEINKPMLNGIHHCPRPGSRLAGDYHGARLDRHGARRIAQQRRVAALIVFHIEFSREIDGDHSVLLAIDMRVGPDLVRHLS
jgi:hypothetical protein